MMEDIKFQSCSHKLAFTLTRILLSYIILDARMTTTTGHRGHNVSIHYTSSTNCALRMYALLRSLLNPMDDDEEEEEQKEGGKKRTILLRGVQWEVFALTP